MLKKAATELTDTEKNLGNNLNEILQSRDKSYYEIGRHILEHYDNDLEELSNKSSKKQKSLRRIVKEMVIGSSFTEIHRMVQVTAQDNFFQEKGIDVSQASYSLKAELISLPNDTEKMGLIQRAMDQKSSVRALRSEVKKIKGLTGNAKAATGSTEAIDSARISGDIQKLAKLLNRLTKGDIHQDLEAIEKDQIIFFRDKTLQVHKSLETLEAKYAAILEAIDSHLKDTDVQGNCPDVGTVAVMGHTDTPDAYSNI